MMGGDDEMGTVSVAQPSGAGDMDVGRVRSSPTDAVLPCASGSQAGPWEGAQPAVDSLASEEISAAIADPTPETLRAVLYSVFSYTEFRGEQLATIQAVMAGRSCLSILPTGRVSLGA